MKPERGGLDEHQAGVEQRGCCAGSGGQAGAGVPASSAGRVVNSSAWGVKVQPAPASRLARARAACAARTRTRTTAIPAARGISQVDG